MDEPIHNCDSMAGTGFRYLWKPEHGWGIYQNEVFLDNVNYRYCVNCDWCGKHLPFIDHSPPEDPKREHRCEIIWRTECFHRRQKNDIRMLVRWDGYEWLAETDEKVTHSRLKNCPYCSTALLSLKDYKNQVLIE